MTPIRQLHDFVDGLPDAVRADLDAASSFRNLAAGERLMRVGSRPASVFQLLEGRVKYGCWDHRGRETVLTYMGCGDWVGLSEVFSELPSQWNVEAQTAVRLRVIRQQDFDRLVSQYPALARQLLRTFALRFSLHRMFGLDHSGLSLKERLIKMLYFLSFSHDRQVADSEPVFMAMSQTELGKVVGASRQKLNPSLKALEQEGLIDIRSGGLSLRSRTAVVARYGHLLNLSLDE